MSEKASYSAAASQGRLGKSASKPPDTVASGAQMTDGPLAHPESNQTKPQGDAAASPIRGNPITSAQKPTQLGSEAPTPTKESPGGTPPAKKQMHDTATAAMPMDLSPTAPPPMNMTGLADAIDIDAMPTAELGLALRTDLDDSSSAQVNALQQ